MKKKLKQGFVDFLIHPHTCNTCPIYYTQTHGRKLTPEGVRKCLNKLHRENDLREARAAKGLQGLQA